MIYGYARVSTQHQRIERQIENIKKYCAEMKGTEPDKIFCEKYTGTVTDRPQWNQLYKKLQAGDTIVFDEVSRMSRNAEDGYKLYKEMLERDIKLFFIKDPAMNTDNYKETLQIAMTGTEVDCILEGVNKYLMTLAEKQIRAAFETAQHEVDYNHMRQAEGIRKAKENGVKFGQPKGKKLTRKNEAEKKAQIVKRSKTFEGNETDTEILENIGLARNTYYKYKRELIAEATK